MERYHVDMIVTYIHPVEVEAENPREARVKAQLAIRSKILVAPEVDDSTIDFEAETVRKIYPESP